MARILEIGGLGVVVIAPGEVLDALDARFAPFLVAAPPPWQPFVLEVAPAPGFAPRLERPEEVRAVVDGDHLRLVGPIAADFVPVRRHCRLAGARGLGAVDAALRLGLGVLLPLDGALLLHAALVSVAGRAFVLAGPSGAGKSTAARALDGACDELVVVRPGPAGVTASATPYWGGRPATVPLDGIVRLSRAGDASPVAVVRRGPEALRLLWAVVVRHVALPEVEAAVLAAAAALCRHLPVIDCRCPEGDAYLPWLSEALFARSAAGWPRSPSGRARRCRRCSS
jgi:hypothetical protein